LLTFSQCNFYIPYDKNIKRKVDIKVFADFDKVKNENLVFSNFQIELIAIDSVRLILSSKFCERPASEPRTGVYKNRPGQHGFCLTKFIY